MATTSVGQRGRWQVRVRRGVLGGMAVLAVMGCQQPVSPTPVATVGAGVASPSPVAAQVSSPSPSPSPVAVVTAVPQVWTVISWQATRPYGKEMFSFSGIVNSDGSGGMREPAGNMGFPPNREKAVKVVELAERLAPYTATATSPTGCLIEFRGRGQAVATEEDKRAVAALASC